MRIMIVEEDAPLADFLAHALLTEHYEVDICRRWDEVLLGNSDMVVLDVSAAAEQAISAIRDIRCHTPMVLLMVLSMRRRSEELAGFLDAGADDYLTKPLAYAELSARIRALRRRTHSSEDSVLRIGDLKMDRVHRQVERGGKVIDLTGKEYSLLEFLMLHGGRRVTRTEILEHVWKALPAPGSTNLVDVYIAYVRKKIDAEAPEKLIHTMRGVGYEISCRQPHFAVEPVVMNAGGRP